MSKFESNEFQKPVDEYFSVKMARKECKEFIINGAKNLLSDEFKKHIIEKHEEKGEQYEKNVICIDEANRITRILNLITPKYVQVKKGRIINERLEWTIQSKEEAKKLTIFNTHDKISLHLFDMLLKNLSYNKEDGQEHATINKKKNNKVNWKQIEERDRLLMHLMMCDLANEYPEVWRMDDYTLRDIEKIMQLKSKKMYTQLPSDSHIIKKRIIEKSINK